MKRIKFGLILMGIIFILNACGISLPGKKPTEGVWYCEELKISIDFSLMEDTSRCAKFYDDKGTYIICECLTDHGTGIFISSIDHETDYLFGSFKYKKNVFEVTSYLDNVKYSFIRIDEENKNN